MGARQCADSALDRLGIAVDGVGLGQPNDGLGDRENIAGTMVDLAGEQDLMLLGALAIGDVDGYAGEPRQVTALVAMGGRDADAPADLAGRP